MLAPAENAVFGLDRFTAFRTLKNSERNCRRIPSRSGKRKLLNNARFVFTELGPISALRPVLPYAPSAGMAKAVDRAADTLRSKSAEAAEAGMDAIDQARDASSSLGDALKTSIERQPFTAISLAVAAGFLFGMMFFRRD